MRSNNPVFARSAEFNGRGAAYGNQSYAGNGDVYAGYGGPAGPQAPSRPTSRMTIDSVVQKTAMSLGVVLVTAFATWILTGDLTTDPEAAGTLLAAAGLGALVAFGLSLVNSFKRVISPALVLAFCAAEGVALGAISKVFDAQFGDGIVTNAVLGTFGAFVGTLAAYKFFAIKVTDKFRKGVIAAMFGMVALGLMEMVLQFFGAGIGIFGFGAMGVIFAAAGLVLGILMLILDFDFVEKGVAAGIPERESWRAAFAMTVSLVWIYTNLLRLLAIFSSD